MAAYPNATVVTSIDNAIAVIKGYDDDTKPCRVIIRRGQTFTLTASTNFGKKSRWPSTHWLAANEAGPVPTINSTNGDIFWNDLDTTGNGNDKDWILQGLKFIGGWNPQTESGTTNNGIQLQGNPPQQFLLDGVTLQDFGGRNFSTTQVNAPYHVFLNDCYLDGWRFYGIYMSGVQVCAITGSVLEQDPLANAGGPKDGAHNNHGPCRIASAGGTKALVHSSEFYSRNDWFQAGGWWGQQPNFRFDTSGIGGAKLNMQSNVLEGGTNIMVFGAESGASNRAINATIEKNNFLASHSTRKGVALAKGGVTFRNNIIVFPDTPQNSGFEASSFITSSWDGEVAGEQNEPINIYNNTMVNLLSSELTELNTSGWAALTNRNNLIYQPNTGSPQTADGPLDMTQAFMPTELGYKDSDTPLQSAYATPPSSVAIYAPLPESEALGDAMNGAVAYDDFYGNERPQYPSRGALETP